MSVAQRLDNHNSGNEPLKGGEYLVRDSSSAETFTPEDFNEEQKMIKSTCDDFIKTEVLPLEKDIDSMEDPQIIPNLLKAAGELGLLGITAPEEYAGFNMDTITAMLVAEGVGPSSSFAVAFAAHTGIGTLPVELYGSKDQKDRYLKGLVSGEILSAYCLTEPDSGSDANAAKSRAILSEDGKSYKITGQKMWITNGGFADLLIVFARIDDDKNLTAFLIESDTPGVSMNEEENKMGIKGSSTRQIFFNDCIVPANNLLGGRNNGFKIALNVLNIGRIKLGAAVLGGARRSMNMAAKYAMERKQFGEPIANYGAIQHKLAKMQTYIFGLESSLYRCSQQINDLKLNLIEEGVEMEQARLKSVEEYSIECAILKVFGSETLDYVVDENVQIHGGMGYSADALAEKAYRDARINRIFEGTNEINRMLMVGQLLKKGIKGQLDLIGPAQRVAKELTAIPSLGSFGDKPFFHEERKVLENLKKAFLLISGAAVKTFGIALKDEQEIMMHAADVMMNIYILESMILRTEKKVERLGEQKAQAEIAMTRCFLEESLAKCSAAGREAISSFAEADELNMLLLGLKRFTKSKPINTRDYRRAVAKGLLESL